MNRRYRLALIGFGTVGQGLVEILRDRGTALADRFGVEVLSTAVSDLRKGSAYRAEGFEPAELLDAAASNAIAELPADATGWDALETIESATADVVAELSFTNLETGEPGLSHVQAAATPEEAVRDQDMAVTATPSHEPIVEGSWLQPGMHLTAMGSDAESKRELTAGALTAADLFVCDHPEQSVRLGELRALNPDQRTSVPGPVALGAIVAGDHPGRVSDDQATICDLTGTGVQDTVIARIAYRRCRDANLGTIVR